MSHMILDPTQVRRAPVLLSSDPDTLAHKFRVLKALLQRPHIEAVRLVQVRLYVCWEFSSRQLHYVNCKGMDAHLLLGKGHPSTIAIYSM